MRTGRRRLAIVVKWLAEDWLVENGLVDNRL